jgi:hypothetical protein
VPAQERLDARFVAGAQPNEHDVVSCASRRSATIARPNANPVRQIVLIVDRLMPNEGAALISRVES